MWRFCILWKILHTRVSGSLKNQSVNLFSLFPGAFLCCWCCSSGSSDLWFWFGQQGGGERRDWRRKISFDLHLWKNYIVHVTSEGSNVKVIYYTALFELLEWAELMQGLRAPGRREFVCKKTFRALKNCCCCPINPMYLQHLHIWPASMLKPLITGSLCCNWVRTLTESAQKCFCTHLMTFLEHA